ncbi:chorismate--pyruvate lyase family protein [Legionella impletisoli]|uniref:4-hydroxybenzoate synthetase n=1 Tax=Legionella impletisoli TaxID=343510 RepID=A0A917JQN0_9GAMM|nr:chorismate lyase [Legionella impletisoli]GGI77809.1 4-hydroxybenzoate synthetase [Legionella impletisoli]
MPPNPDSLLKVNSEPPSGLTCWINSTDSLTEQLKTQTGDACLQLLRQEWCLPNWWDKQVLHIQDKWVMHREILMHSHQYTCWYARTIVPEKSYKNNACFFNRLNKEPLTNLIFNNSSVERVSFIRYPITSETIEYYWLEDFMHQHQLVLWARLAEYKIHAVDSFYLLELLLPDLLECAV